MKNQYLFIILAILLISCNSKQKQNNHTMGTYGFDVDFFKSLDMEMIELKDNASGAAVLIGPGYQGRVMTSTATGKKGNSFGWINHEYIKKGELNDQFNPFGGEERFWLGPEGGPFSIYFDKGAEQSFEHWRVPKELDTESFEVVRKSKKEVSFKKSFVLSNASGTSMKLKIDRSVKLLTRPEINDALNAPISDSLSCVAYETGNSITNIGKNNWTEDKGFLSIWLLCMFNPGEKGVVFLPYVEGEDKDLGKIIEDDYFGKVPSERLILKDGVAFFKVDGKHRSKIGLSPQRSTPFCGSYDPGKKTLTILWYSKPAEDARYVNSKWGDQEDPLKGDALNSYNDGPLDDGSILGPFYEIESSSPAALLNAGESLKHSQRIFHISGEEDMLDQIVKNVFDLSIEEIKSVFE